MTEPQTSEAAVLEELGEAAGANEGVLDASAALAAAHEEELAAAGIAPNQTLRQERLQRNRDTEIARIAAEEKAERDLMNSVGAIEAGYSDDQGLMDNLFSDDQGRPLYYFSRRSKRVMRATEQMHRPDMIRKFGLMPCQPPAEERERIMEKRGAEIERRRAAMERQREAEEAAQAAEREAIAQQVMQGLKEQGYVITPPGGQAAPSSPPTPTTDANATASALEHARANDIDINVITGTGQNGQITKPDVEAAIKARDAANG